MQKRYGFWRFIAFALLVVSIHQAEAATLSEIFRHTLQKNENVPIQTENTYQANETRLQAIAKVLPKVSFSDSQFWQQDVATSFGPISPPYQPLAKFVVSQPLFQGGAEYAGWAFAKNQLHQQKAQQENVEITLYKSVVSAFYNVL